MEEDVEGMQWLEYRGTPVSGDYAPTSEFFWHKASTCNTFMEAKHSYM